MKKPLIKIENVSFAYRNRNNIIRQVLSHIDLEVNNRDRISIIGPSGCGKTSLLLLFAGLRVPDEGTIWYKDKKCITPSNKRVIIFQNHVLFPWMTAIQNIEFVLRAKKMNSRLIRKEAEKYLNLVHLSKYRDNYPHELSGGMQQRIGIARALSADPEILLFDEPFASLDSITKGSIQNEVLSIAGQFGKTMIFVTHNIEEAIYLGNRVIVMSRSPGKIIKEFDITFKKQPTIFNSKKASEFIKLEIEIHSLLQKDN